MKPILSVFVITLMLTACSSINDRTSSAEDSAVIDPREVNAEVFLQDIEDVRVIEEPHQTVKEYRFKGELVLVEVKPKDGLTYYIDPKLNKRIPQSSQDLIDSGVKPVYWIIKEF